MKCNPGVVALHSFVDTLVAHMSRKSAELGRPVQCRGERCSACCYEPVQVERREIEHALGRLTPQTRRYVKERTKVWYGHMKDTGLLEQVEPSAFEWRSYRAACPFLFLGPEEINGYNLGHCLIYADRPLSCRLHCAVGEPVNCFDDKLRVHQTYMQGDDNIKEQTGMVMAKTLNPEGKTGDTMTLEMGDLGSVLVRLLLKG